MLECIYLFVPLQNYQPFVNSDHSNQFKHMSRIMTYFKQWWNVDTTSSGTIYILATDL